MGCSPHANINFQGAAPERPGVVRPRAGKSARGPQTQRVGAASAGLTGCGEAIETAFVIRAFFHRAEAAVLMKDATSSVVYPG
jgi:hypothetical protein